MRLARTLGCATAVAVLIALALSGRSAGDWISAVTGPRGWLAGLALGLLLAWLFGVDWRSIPYRVSMFIRTKRRDIGWGAIAAASLAFLVVG
jgi:hypothetical protein